MAHLPSPSWIVCLQTEETLPITHPSVERNRLGTWSAKQMQMIGHENIAPHQPGERLSPNLFQSFMDYALR
jgi:hypothetical protein